MLCQIYADPPFLGRQKVNDPPLNSSGPPPLLKNECSLRIEKLFKLFFLFIFLKLAHYHKRKNNYWCNILLTRFVQRGVTLLSQLWSLGRLLPLVIHKKLIGCLILSQSANNVWTFRATSSCGISWPPWLLFLLTSVENWIKSSALGKNQVHLWNQAKCGIGFGLCHAVVFKVTDMIGFTFTSHWFVKRSKLLHEFFGFGFSTVIRKVCSMGIITVHSLVC